MICDDCTQILEAVNLVQFFSPLILMSMLIPFALLVISLVFSALISMPKAAEVLSRRSTREASYSSFPARPSMSSAKRKLVIVLPPMLKPACSSEMIDSA